MNEKDLEVYVIMKNPTDYREHDRPGQDIYVVRHEVIGRTGVPVVNAKWHRYTLEDARKSVPEGFCCLHRHPADLACILETWI